jgi:hypothetical protein
MYERIYAGLRPCHEKKREKKAGWHLLSVSYLISQRLCLSYFFWLLFTFFTFLLVLFCPGFDSGFESTEILLPSQTKTKRKGLGDVWIKGGGARVFVYVCVCVRAHTYFASKPNRK